MAQYTITFVEIYVTSVPRSILLRMYDEHFRDSRPEMLYKKRCSEAFREDHRKTPSIVPFFTKKYFVEQMCYRTHVTGCF